MADLLSAVIRGMTFGSVYALLAVGLVLTYKTSGVFNLAFGAQAFVAGGGLLRPPRPPRLADPGRAAARGRSSSRRSLGFLLDRVLFRYLRTASSTAQLVTVLGLLVAIPQIVDLWFGAEPTVSGTGHRSRRSNVVQPVRRTCSSAATTSRRSSITLVDRGRARRCCSATPRSGCACARSSRARG